MTKLILRQIATLMVAVFWCAFLKATPPNTCARYYDKEGNEWSITVNHNYVCGYCFNTKETFDLPRYAAHLQDGVISISHNGLKKAIFPSQTTFYPKPRLRSG